MSSTTLKNYLATATELPTDVLLGRLVMFRITDEAVLWEDLEAWSADLGLNPNLLPPKPRTVDAFKKATTAIDGRKYRLSTGNVAHLLSRDVSASPTAIVRQITREVQDASHRRLSYGRAIECVYERPRIENGAPVIGSERVRFEFDPNEVAEEERDTLRSVARELKTIYDRHAMFMDGMKLRAYVREYVKYLNAIEVKGGVYFVHVTRDQEILALQEIVARMGGGCRMFLIPIIDMPEMKDFVIANFQRENAEAFERLARDAAALTDSGKRVTPKALATLQQRYDETLTGAEEYVRRLGVSRTEVKSAADVAQVALTALGDKVLADAT